MSDTTATPAVVIRPIPPTAPAAEPEALPPRKCANPTCNWMFIPCTGKVPPLRVLYQRERNGNVDLAHPLSRSEVLNQELCRRCGSRMPFKTFPTGSTLRLMERLVRENAEWLTRTREREAARKESRHRANLAKAIKAEDGNDINKIIASGGRPYNPHRKPRVRRKERAPKQNSESQQGKKRGGEQKGRRKH